MSASDKLKGFIKEIERLEDEKRNIAANITAAYADAKAEGFDVKTMREVVKRRRMKPHELAERDEMLAVYLTHMGMRGTPLGDYAEQQEAA